MGDMKGWRDEIETYCPLFAIGLLPLGSRRRIVFLRKRVGRTFRHHTVDDVTHTTAVKIEVLKGEKLGLVAPRTGSVRIVTFVQRAPICE